MTPCTKLVVYLSYCVVDVWLHKVLEGSLWDLAQDITELTSRLIKPLTRPPAGGRNASGPRINTEILHYISFIFYK